MKFGSVSVSEAAGAVLAHSVQAGSRRLRKAHRLDDADIEALRQAGVESVVVARFDPGDISEDDAASRIAASLGSTHVSVRDAATGRVNLHAEADGVFRVDKARVDALNTIDPAITLATLPDFAPVTRGQMVATVKIIPFAVAADLVEAAARVALDGSVFQVAPFRPRSVILIQTELSGVKATVLDKTAKVTAARLNRSGSQVVSEIRVPHAATPLANALERAVREADLVIMFGGSAVSDAADVIPSAIRLAGGTVLRVGMPVDPGNLLVLGRVGEIPVLGAPGCARSPKENGFDWILNRLLADIDVTDADIAALGVGGLLMEIPARPMPRERPAARSAEVHAVLLAAGTSSRMGGPNKLLAQFDGEPLVRHVATRIGASTAPGLSVVTGHQADRIAAALIGLDVAFAHNPDFASGLASSLRAGIASLPPDAAGALVVLGDMPKVTTSDLDRMMTAFISARGEVIVRATHAGKRGNPVILPRSTFAEIEKLEGDTGARAIVESGRYVVIDIEIGSAASIDVDTPEALRLAGGVL